MSNLTYSYKIAMQYIEQRKFRDEILEELVALYEGLSVPDFVNMSQCLIHLDRPQQLSTILDKLIKDDSLKSKSMVRSPILLQLSLIKILCLRVFFMIECHVVSHQLVTWRQFFTF